MSLSDHMRYQIAHTFIVSFKNDIFKHGTYYTNGESLVYVSSGRSEEYAIQLNRKDGAKPRGPSFVNIQELIPPGYQYTPDYDALIYGYRNEFMRFHKVEPHVFYQHFSKNDVLKWIAQKYPQKIDKCDEIAIEFIKTTLLDIEEVFDYENSPVFARQS